MPSFRLFWHNSTVVHFVCNLYHMDGTPRNNMQDEHKKDVELVHFEVLGLNSQWAPHRQYLKISTNIAIKIIPSTITDAGKISYKIYLSIKWTTKMSVRLSDKLCCVKTATYIINILYPPVDLLELNCHPKSEILPQRYIATVLVHMTSLVTWPSDPQWMVSFKWPIDTNLYLASLLRFYASSIR